MRTVQTLLDECIEVCDGQAQLARRIGIERQDVQHMASGKRPISPATVGLLCDVLQLEAEEARRLAVLAVINTAKAEKQGVLRRAFFVLLTLGAGLGTATVPTTNAEASTAVSRAGDSVKLSLLHSLYIVRSWVARLTGSRTAAAVPT